MRLPCFSLYVKIQVFHLFMAFMKSQNTFLILAILLGSVTGYWMGEIVPYLKPIGDIFLNLLFTIIVPLIFFSVACAVARAGSSDKISKIFYSMFSVFLMTSIVAASLTLFLVMIFPPAKDVVMTLSAAKQPVMNGFLNQIVSLFTVAQFSDLFSHQHMLALIVFSLLLGGAVSSVHTKHQLRFLALLEAGESIFMRMFSLIMYVAPIGFFAYFAVLVHELGLTLLQSYARVTCLYYIFAALYFVLVYTLYAYLAYKESGIQRFWKNIGLPATTAIATCSGAASIPANLVATKNMGVPAEIAEIMIPVGTMIHKDGSMIGGMIKIAFLFGLFHLKFAGVTTLLTALGVSILVGSVMGAIPSGGMLGELLILSVYGFPSSALLVIAAISILIDPIATLLNVTGNSISSLMCTRLVEKLSA